MSVTHRLPALRLALSMAIIFAIASMWNADLLIVVIVNAAFGLFLLSPLADRLEHKAR